jgi:16S rRNA (cytidine1402-2'-O)-methyltransferase
VSDRVQKQQKTGFAIAGSWFDAPVLATGLYVVATPIGNLRDVTLRALETLAACNLVLCEDTRFSTRLLDHYAISTPKMAVHEHNERARISTIIERLKQGQSIALISDAGTPLLSDPGFPLVRAVREAGLDVFALPGPSALLGALTTAGLPTDRFTFVGFLPAKSSARNKMLQTLATNTETLVFYESPRRLGACLSAMAKIFGGQRQAAVALELTKKFERTLSGTLGELAERLEKDSQKGEAVILVSGAPEVSEDDEGRWIEALELALRDQPLRGAVDEISQAYGLRRKQVYDAALKLKP